MTCSITFSKTWCTGMKTCGIVGYIFDNSPTHLFPVEDSWNPSGHSHLKLPGVFTHLPKMQISAVWEHSSISEQTHTHTHTHTHRDEAVWTHSLWALVLVMPWPSSRASLTFTPVVLQEVSRRTDAPVRSVQILARSRAAGPRVDQTLVDVWAEETWCTAVGKMIITLVFSAAKNDLKSVISIFCYSVSVSVYHVCAPHRDLIWSSSVCLESHEKTEQTETKSRRTVSQDASRNLLQSSWETLLKSTEDKTCFKHKDAHNKYWFHLVNRS